MATNTSVNLTSLDFDDYKEDLKTFLKSQSQFKDYDFEASNLSVLIDLLTYNTYKNAFYLNMVSSEMFLDTAQLRDSVVLRAKELNYLPRSFRSSTALINLKITPTSTDKILLTIPAGTSFTGKAGSNSYTFSTSSNLVLKANTDGNFYASNVAIYEGTSISDTFVIQPVSNTDTQALTLSNQTIDTNSLEVVSVENGGANAVPYSSSSTLLDLTEDSFVYFIQGGDDSKYQIIFGDNVVGRRPLDNSVIVATYLATNGQLPNGIAAFTPDGTIGGESNVIVSTVAAAAGGDISEDINSIRYNAPRYYATQERAVTASDYETILKVTYPEIEDLAVYGGEEASPPQFGKVLISMKLYGFDYVPDAKKKEYISFLKTRAPIEINTIFVEPDYTYVSVVTTIKYNVNQTTLQPTDIEAFVTSAIQDFNAGDLSSFNSTLLYSKLVEAIDDAHPSIISNQTTYQLMKKLVPSVTTKANYDLEFGAPLEDNLPPEPANHDATDVHAISSSKFIYNGAYTQIEDDSNGNLRLVQTSGDQHQTVLSSGVGSIDYDTGKLSLTGFYTPSWNGDAIRIYAIPRNLDNSTPKNSILEIPNDEINVAVNIVRQ